MKKRILFLVLMVLFFSETYAQIPTYKRIPIIGNLLIENADYNDMSTIDLDNNGTLDVVTSFNSMYKNEGNNTFTLLPYITNFFGTYNRSRVDIDNDGDIDYIYRRADKSIYLLENEGLFSFREKKIVENIEDNGFFCYDIDNDGKKDILLYQTDIVSQTKTLSVLRNEGNHIFSTPKVLFQDILYYYPRDCNNDTKIDFFIKSSNSDCFVAINLGNGLFSKKSITAKDFEEQAGTWYYDYNADGLTDMVVFDPTRLGYVLYINKGNNEYEKTNINIPLSITIDIDNNGLLDFYSWDEFGTYLFLNRGNLIWDRVLLWDVWITDIFDSNNDGRMDLLSLNISTFDGQSADSLILYLNTSSVPNVPPTAPTNLRSFIQGDSIVFMWDRATDTETPALALMYNLRIGSTPGACDILSPMALSNGKRLVVTRGNVNQRLAYALNNFKGGDVYWTVQAIDNSFAGSPFAPEQAITFRNSIRNTSSTDRLEINRKDITFEVEESKVVDFRQWKVYDSNGTFIDVSDATGTSFSPTINQVGTYFVFCESTIGTATAQSNILTINVFAPEISISGSIPTCFISRQNGASFTVNYDLVGVYSSDNQFIAYLSDKNGDFSTKTQLNSLVSNTQGVFTVNIPSGIPDGSNYKIRLESTHPQATSNASTNFTIELNDAPYDIVLSNNKLAENQDIGTTVGTIQAQDLDSDDSFSYTLLSNSTNFILEDNTLKTNRLFDYETESTVYTVAIQATDNHNASYIQTFNISIDNVNEAPTLSLPNNLQTRENTDISITGFVVDDVDVFGGNVKVSVSCENGVLRFGQLNTNEIISGSQNSSSIVFEGTLNRINQIINSLIYRGNRYFYGNEQLKISVSDLGNTGSGDVQIVEKTLSLTIPTPPKIIVQPVSLIKGCVNDNMTFSISVEGIQPIEYQWYKDDIILYNETKNIINIDVKSVEQAGNYYCIATNIGGSTQSNNGELQLKPQKVEADIKPIKLCSGDPTGSILINATGGWGDYLYSIDNATHFSTSQVFENLHVGTYTIVIKDNNNCSTTKDFVVEAPELLKLNINAKNIACKDYKNGELNINVVGGTPPFSIDIQSISINETLNFDSNSAQKNYKNLIPDVYTINIKDQNLCDTFAVVRLTEPDKLVFTSKPSSVACYGDRNGELNFTVNGGTEPYCLYWTNSEMTNLIKDFKSGTYNLSEIAKVSGLLAGKYEFYITDSQSCETSQNVDIQSPTKLEISFTDNTLIAKGGTLPYEYSQNGRSFGTANTFPNLESGVYNFTVRDSKSCLSSISQYVENKSVIGEKPVVDFMFYSEYFDANFVGTVLFATSCSWDFGDGTYSSETTTKHSYSKVGSYQVVLTAYNEFGFSQIEKTIQVVGKPTNVIHESELDFMIYPNPTEDEVFITCTTTKSLIITVFDASGRKVLETKNLHFSVKDLAKGFYTVKIGNTSKKLIIR